MSDTGVLRADECIKKGAVQEVIANSSKDSLFFVKGSIFDFFERRFFVLRVHHSGKLLKVISNHQ